MKAFQANLAKLEGSDTQVLGVSIDSPFANHAFALEDSVTFPLLGDMDATAIKAYGLDKEYTIGGVKILSARRASFLVDKDGRSWRCKRTTKPSIRPRSLMRASFRSRRSSAPSRALRSGRHQLTPAGVGGGSGSTVLNSDKLVPHGESR